VRRPDRGPHSPADVPEEDGAVDVRAGVDTDGDARPDTLLTIDGHELLVHTDLDGDGLADQVLGIGPDGTVREVAPPWPAAGARAGVLDGLLGGAGAGG
jgi:hypothetical protein